MAEQKMRDFLDKYQDVNFIRFIFMDLSAILRVSVVPRNSVLELAKHGSLPSFASPSMTLLTFTDEILFENVKIGVDDLIPDWDSIKICTFYPAHAMVMCAVREPPAEVPDNPPETEKELMAKLGVDDGFDLCTRSVLRKQVTRAARAGQTLLIGMELEFLLYEPGTVEFHSRAKQSCGFNTTSLYNTETVSIVDEIIMFLEKVGIKIMKYNTEPGARGNFELVLAPLPPMEAADAMVYCRETIKTVAQNHGHRATLMPLPFEQGSSSLGAHTNISMSELGKNNDSSMSFLSGILENLCAFSAFTNPSPRLSAARINRSDLYRHVRWGENNKFALVRQRRPGLWEVRNPDSTMNPYLAFAALIAAGMSGLESKRELTMKPLPGSFATIIRMTAEQKVELGIKEEMPDTLGAALIRLENNQELRGSLGERLVKAYISIKQKEIKDCNSLTGQELCDKLMQVF
jgi:glutamine synthetase